MPLVKVFQQEHVQLSQCLHGPVESQREISKDVRMYEHKYNDTAVLQSILKILKHRKLVISLGFFLTPAFHASTCQQGTGLMLLKYHLAY